MTTRTRVYCSCGMVLAPSLDHCGRAVCAAREAERARQAVALDPLAQCIIVGCPNPRHGANLCRACDSRTTALAYGWSDQ